MENLEFLDTPVHVHVHVATIHEYQDYNDINDCEYTTNYGFIHVSFVWNVAHVRFFSSKVCEFLYQENFC